MNAETSTEALPAFNPVDVKFEAALCDLIQKHALALNDLTERQLAGLIGQIIRSGDIVKYVVKEPGCEQKQCMVYEPFREVERLKQKVQRIESALKEITTCPTCEGTGKWTPECHACLAGYGTCTCKNDPPETCPQCEGTGREYWKSEQAKAYLEEP